MQKNLVVATFAVFGLGACAGTTDLPRGYAPETNRSEGLAVVSLSVAGKDLRNLTGFEYRLREVLPPDETPVVSRRRYDSATQHARALHDGGAVQGPIARRLVVSGNGSGEPLDLMSNGRVTGRLAVLRLPPGDYEFHAWALREKMPGGEMEYGPARDFSYRFHVAPGKVAYLGRLNLQLSERATQKLAVEDWQKDDLALLEKKHPELARLAVVPAVGKLVP